MKNLNYMKLILIAVILVMSGAILGSYITKKSIDKIEGSTFEATRIAIINLDEGVDYEGAHRNFAKELLNAQNQDIVLTGLDDAKTGLQDGRYSAYLVMPSDFSANTVTINTEPQKSLIKYEINQNLSDAARDKAIVNVSQITKKINDDLGYVYLYSLFNSLHEGQNNAVKVLNNDSQDKEVLMAISNVNLVESLDMRELERQENNIEKLDLVDDFEKNQELIHTIDAAYKTYLSSTTEEISNIKMDADGVKQNLTKMGMDIANLPMIESSSFSLEGMGLVVKNHNEELLTSKTKVKEDFNVKKIDSDVILTNAKNKIKLYLDSIDTYNTTIVEFNKYGDIKTNLEDMTNTLTLDKMPGLQQYLSLMIKERQDTYLQDFLKNYMLDKLMAGYGTYPTKDIALDEIFKMANKDEAIKSVIELYSAFHPDLEIRTLQDYYLKVFEVDSGMSSVYPDETTIFTEVLQNIKTGFAGISNPLKEQLKTLHETFPPSVKTTDIRTDLTVFDKYSLDFSTIDTTLNEIKDANQEDLGKAVEQDLNPLKENQIQYKNELLNTSFKDTQYMDSFDGRLKAYDPLAFIKEYEINGFIRNYQQNNTFIESKINTKDTEYKKFVDSSYKQANEHVQTIQEDIRTYQKLSDEKLTKGLEGAQASRMSTSGENQALLKNFINTLPYSRLGENANTSVFQFMVEPVSEQMNVTLNNHHVNQEIDYNLLYISIIGGCLIIFVGICMYSYFKKRQKLSEKI